MTYWAFPILLLLHHSLAASITFPAIINTASLTDERVFHQPISQSLALRRTERVDIPFGPQDGFLIHVPVHIGNPPQQIKLRLSTREHFIWVKSSNQNGFDEKQSITCKTTNDTMLIETFHTSGRVTIDDISVGSLTLHGFPFLLVAETHFEDAGILGLGKGDSKDKQFGFIDYLLDRHFISKRMFYLSISQNRDSFTIGEFPYETLSEENTLFLHKHKITHLKGKSNMSKIATTLSAVFIEGESSLWEVNDFVSFSYGSNCIIVSWEFFDHLRHAMLKNELESGVCKYNDNKGYEYFSCYKSKFKQKTISFVLGDWTYKLNDHDYLLKDSGDLGLLGLVKNKKFNGWALGYHFYKKYLAVFDIDEDVVSIYYHP